MSERYSACDPIGAAFASHLMAAGMRVGVPDLVVESIEKVMRDREGLAVRSRFGAGPGPLSSGP
jgi:hypothetical protein